MIPALLWPYRLKTVEERTTVFLLLVFLTIAIFPLSGFMLHYVAPIVGLLYARFLQTLARLQGWRPWGKILGPAVAVLLVGLFGIHFAASVAFRINPPVMLDPVFATTRNSIAQSLARMPGRLLVLVRYEPGHNPANEWVWNRADIDASQTVWARAMDADKDRELIRYYRDRQPDRQVWMLEPDRFPLRLAPYSTEEASR
jgi:hypothetical protein